MVKSFCSQYKNSTLIFQMSIALNLEIVGTKGGCRGKIEGFCGVKGFRLNPASIGISTDQAVKTNSGFIKIKIITSHIDNANRKPTTPSRSLT